MEAKNESQASGHRREKNRLWALRVLLAFAMTLISATPAFSQFIPSLPTQTISGTSYVGGLTNVGLLNGDQVPDFTIGVSEIYPATPGYVRVFDGATRQMLFQLNGATLAERFGVVAGIGNVNGLGGGDLAIGAPGMAGACGPTENCSHPSRVLFVEGSNGTTIHQIQGIPGEGLGTRVFKAGDYTGDQRSEVLISGPSFVVGGAKQGRVLLYDVANHAIVHQFAPVQLGATTHLGFAAAGNCDVNGDGSKDILLSEGGEYLPGKIDVFSGATGFPLLFQIGGTTQTWRDVQCAGDLDQDGFEDILVSNPIAGGFPFFRGAVAAYSGRTRQEMYHWTGADSPNGFGSSIQAAGDVNGDGFPDVIVGDVMARPILAGSTVPAPPNSGRLMIFSGRTGALMDIIAEPTGAMLCCSFAAMGDLSGDGRSDVLVLEPRPVGAFSGSLYLFANLANGLPSPSVNLGFGTPGTAGIPNIDLRGALNSGSVATLTVSQAAPNASGLLLVSPQTAFSTIAGIGLVVPDLSMAIDLPFQTDSSGTFQIPLPGGAFGFLDLFVQVAMVDTTGAGGFTLSNGLMVNFQQ